MSPKFRVNWPTLISSFSQIISFTLHPFLTHFVLTNISFTFPATIALVQVSTTAVCLWFWSIFGLYRIRTIPLHALLPLAASTAALTLLAVFTLATTSLLIFQTARLLSATLVLAIRSNSPFPFLFACVSTVLLVLPNHGNLVIPICYASLASANAFILHPIAAKTKATELQLQVLLRTIASILLLPPAILLDDYTNSVASIRQFAFNDTAIILVFSTGLVAFFSFTASRAAINRLSPEMHNWLLLAANLAVYATHFIISDDDLHPWQVLGVFGLAASWYFLAAKRRTSSENHEEQGERERDAV